MCLYVCVRMRALFLRLADKNISVAVSPEPKLPTPCKACVLKMIESHLEQLCMNCPPSAAVIFLCWVCSFDNIVYH